MSRADGLERIGKHLWGRCKNCGRLIKVTGWARGLHICAEGATDDHQ